MKGVLSLHFALLRNIESGKTFIIYAGQYKHKCLNKDQLYLLKIFKNDVQYCATLKEVAKTSGEYVKHFKENFPELYL